MSITKTSYDCASLDPLQGKFYQKGFYFNTLNRTKEDLKNRLFWTIEAFTLHLTFLGKLLCFDIRIPLPWIRRCSFWFHPLKKSVEMVQRPIYVLPVMDYSPTLTD